MRKLNERVTALEHQLIEAADFVPYLDYFDIEETEAQALARYRKTYGVDYPADMPIICFEVYDASKKTI